MATHRADHAFRVTVRAVALVAVAFAVVAGVRGSANAALSTLLGGGTAVLNLLAMRRIVASLVSGTAEGDLGRGKTWGTLAVVKLFGLLVGVALLLTRGIAAPVPFIFGYAAMPIGIAIAALMMAGRTDDE